MKKIILFSVISILLKVAVGCAEVDSADIRTSGIHFETTVTVEDDRAAVLTRLKTSNDFGADNIRLSAADRLTANLSGQAIGLPRSNDAYRGSFAFDAGGERMTIQLAREEGISAMQTNVVLPEQFAITAPNQATPYNAGDTITVVWSPGVANSSLSVNYSAQCTLADGAQSLHGGRVGRVYTVPDSGTHTVSVNDILNAFDDQQSLARGISCPLQISVERENSGSVDRAFQGGSIKALRRKMILANIVP